MASDRITSPPVTDELNVLAPRQWKQIEQWVEDVVRSCVSLNPSVFQQIKEDLFQEGLATFVQAFHVFDQTRGVPLPAYLRQQIAFAIRDYLRNLDPLPRSLRTHARQIAVARDKLYQENRSEPSINDIAQHCGIPAVRVAFILRYEESPVHSPHVESLPIPTDATQDPVLLVETTQQRLALREALFALPEKQRQVITWRYIHGFTVRQIADRLAITPSAVSQLSTRALKNVQKELTEQDWITTPQPPRTRQ